MTTSDFLGLGGGTCEGWPIKVKDMILKQAIQDKREADAKAIRAFQDSGEGPQEV